MSTITVQELQQNPSAFVDRVEAGEHFVLVREGRPVAELHPVQSVCLAPRPVGLCKGAFIVPEDFDAPLSEEIVQEFEGR